MINHTGRIGLARTLRMGGVGAEIGVARGDYASKLLRIAQPSKFLLIDAWEPYEVPGTAWCSDRGAHEDNYKKVTDRFRFHNEVQIIRARSLDAIRSIRDWSLDWVYIDACHKFESVLSELHALWPKMSCNGVIAGHDFVKKNGYGVIEAVEEFCFYSDWNLDGIFYEPHDPDLHPSFTLRKSTCPR